MPDWIRCPACGTRVPSELEGCNACGASLSSAATAVGGDPAEGASELAGDGVAAELQRALGRDFQILRKLPAGAMSAVYLALEPALRRLVAVKVLTGELAKDAVARARFAREAEAAAAVSHPHVVGIYRVGSLPRSKVPYFVMEYVDGVPAGAADGEEAGAGILHGARAKRVVGEVASALAVAHARGLVHRDVKPSNILIDRESGRAVLLDFGVSAVVDPSRFGGAAKLTRQGTSVGTPVYMSPEQAAAREVTDRSDVYSLGAVAFELVTGRPPFQEHAPEAYLAAHLEQTPPDVGTLRPDLDPLFADLINRCLAKNPARRPAAAEVARALIPEAHQPVEWPPPGLDRLWGRGWSLLLALAGAAALAFGFLAAAAHGSVDSALHLVPLGTLLLATGLTALAALVLAGRLAIQLAAARAAGYPWQVVLRVSLDPGRDTGALLSGGGTYALLGQRPRRWLLRLRNARWMALALVVVVAPVTLIMWRRGLLAGASPQTGVLGGREFMVVVGPVAAVALLAALAAAPEWFVRARGRGLGLRRWHGRLLVHPELVRAWLAPQREPAAPPSRRWGWVGPAAAPALTLGVGAALLLVLGLVFASERTAAQWRRVADPAARALERIAAAANWEDANAEVRAVGRLPAATPLEQAAAARWPVADSAAAMLLAGGASRAMLDAPRAPWWLAGSTGALTTARRALADSSVLPLLASWRGVARLRRPPELWRDREEGPEPLRLSEGGTWTLARLNDADGLAAAADGDTSAALARAQENLAVGRWLLADPVNGHLAARVLELGRAGLFDLGVVAGDRALLARAERLGSVLPPDDRLSAVERRRGAAFLMTDPAAPGGLATIADATTLPYVRAALIGGVADGFCGNARELAIGVDRRRLDVLARADSLARDLRHAGRLTGRAVARVEAWAAGTTPPVDRVPRRGLLRVLGWIGLGGAADRLGFCRAQLVPDAES